MKKILILLSFLTILESSCLKENSFTFYNKGIYSGDDALKDSLHINSKNTLLVFNKNPYQTNYQEIYYKEISFYKEKSINSKYFATRPFVYILIEDSIDNTQGTEQIAAEIEKYLAASGHQFSVYDKIFFKYDKAYPIIYNEYFDLPQSKLIHSSAMQGRIKNNAGKIKELEISIEKNYKNFLPIEIEQLTILQNAPENTFTLSTPTVELLQYYVSTFDLDLTYEQQKALMKIGIAFPFLENSPLKENKTLQDFIVFLKTDNNIKPFISSGLRYEQNFYKNQNEYLNKMIQLYTVNNYAENSANEGSFLKNGFALILNDSDTKNRFQFQQDFNELQTYLKDTYNITVSLAY